MTGWRATTVRWSLVLALAAGLVGMHSLLVGGGGPAAGPAAATMSTTAASMSTAPMTAASMTAASATAAPMTAAPMTAASATAAPGEHGVAHSAPSGAPGHHGDGMSGMLHLCLAVLGALLLGLVAPLLLAVLRRRAGATRAVTGRASPRPQPRAPPPTPLRLAQLCVSRR